MRKLRTDYGAADIYNYYCESTGNPKKLSQKEYSKITGEFFTKILDSLIMKGIEFNLPYRLGNLVIKKSLRKIKLNTYGTVDKRLLAPDWQACRRLWKEKYPDLSWEEIKKIKQKPMIFHLNRHSDGYVYKWVWDKSTCIAKNSSGYEIEVVRAADRRLAKAVKDETLGLDYQIY